MKSLPSWPYSIYPITNYRECSKHELLNAYPVLVMPNEIVAQFSMTVAILGTSTIALTGLPVVEENFKTDKKIDDEELVALLQVFNKIYFLI